MNTSSDITTNCKPLTHRCALIIVDMQNDFLPGGALAIKQGNEIIPVINSLYNNFQNIILTQDWHPVRHISFASTHRYKNPFDTIDTCYGSQMLWPEHCVQGTHGAEISSDLKTENAQLIIRKGYNKNLDSYSAFAEADHETRTGLAGYFRDKNIDTLFIAGLATEFCVGWTATDAAKHGFDVAVIEDATKGIEREDSLERAWLTMHKNGVKRVLSKDIVTT